MDGLGLGHGHEEFLCTTILNPSVNGGIVIGKKIKKTTTTTAAAKEKEEKRNIQHIISPVKPLVDIIRSYEHGVMADWEIIWPEGLNI